MTIRLACVLALASVAGTAKAADQPTRGDGAFQPAWGVLRAGRAPALASLGDEVVRASSVPALGGTGWMIELHTAPDGWARGRVRFFRTVATYSDWRPAGEMELRVSPSEWSALRRRVDAGLDHGQPPDPPPEPNTVTFCTDGPGYVVERRDPRRERWMTQACLSDDPTPGIVDAVASVALDGWCGYFRTLDSCEARRSALWARERDAPAPERPPKP